jgi:predicted negative regulator of RcsB-dependent stress response
LIRRPAAVIFSILFVFGSFRTGAFAKQADSGENQFGVSITLFSTLAAINAAGYDAGIDSPLNEQFQVRRQIREQLAKQKIASLGDLKDFYKTHLKPNDTQNLSQYISFALSVNGPPNFDFKTSQVPPDVEPMAALSPLLARFYKEANLEDLWNRSQPAYMTAISQYQSAVINQLFECNGYLRNPTSGYTGRRFQIYLDLLAAPDQAQVRSYRDDYYIVITPASKPLIDEIRDAYLAYLLDPLTFKYSTAIADKKALQKFSDDAPALDLAYKDNFSLLVTKCLIKAIDSRIMHAGSGEKQEFVDQAMREGFILTAAFADLLPVYEKQDRAMRLYYGDLVNAIDVRKEQKRLRTVQFVQSVAPKVVAPPSAIQLTPIEQTLETAEGLYEQKDFPVAEKEFKKALQQTDDKALRGRAYYGLARVAVQQLRIDEATEMFQHTIEANPNPMMTAWSHIYLGRIALRGGHAEKANAEFKLALATEGASAQAHDAAEKGIQDTTSSSGGQKQP